MSSKLNGLRVAALGALALSGLVLSACSSSSKPTAARPASGHLFVAALAKPVEIGSTVPPNGDVNPYGLAQVPTSVGKLVQGDTLVSNYNDKANVQGTGTTLVELSPTGGPTTFADLSSLPPGEVCPGGIGLSTALAILPGGWVVVGSVPAGPGGSFPVTDPAGCLIVLNSQGAPVATWTNPDINGPWDMVATPTATGADLFVSNVVSRPPGDTSNPSSGLCTVVRISVALTASGPPAMTASTVIGTNFVWRADKAVFVLGPTGLALARNGTLFVAETPSNHITTISSALTRTSAVSDGSDTLTSGGFLNAPLGMTLAPNGDLLVVNGDDGNIVEISPAGRQLAEHTLIPKGSGDLFGLSVSQDGRQLVFVNDGDNSLDRASQS